MFNKAERARREAAREYHGRQLKLIMNVTDSAIFQDETNLERANARARFHRKQAELWAKSVKAFDDAALRTAKLVGRR